MKKDNHSTSTTLKGWLENDGLQRLFNANCHYVSLQQVQEIVESEGLQYEASTIRRYLGEWQKDGKIFDAGRAWYSDLPETFTPDTAELSELEKIVLEEFPYLDWNAWSTRQLSGFFHHLPAHHITFLMVDRDAIEPVAEALKEQGFTAVAHPTGQLAKNFQLEADDTVIIRPKLSLDQTQKHAPIEQILVDLLYENQKLTLFDTSECTRILRNCTQRYRVEMSTLLRYSERRKVDLPSV